MSRLKQLVGQPKKSAQKLANQRTSSRTSCPTERTSWPTRVGQLVRGPASKVEFGHYADDTQIYGFCDPSDADALQERLLVCIDEVFSRMMSNRLQLNPAKTEVLWCSSARRQHQIPTGPVRVGDTSVLPV